MTAVLDALVATARRTTGAGAAVLLVKLDQHRLEVVSSDGVRSGYGEVEAETTYAGLVLTSEQPIAMRVPNDDLRTGAERLLLGRPPNAICCVPCGAGSDVNGVLELIDKPSTGMFDFDDVEVATMLADVAAVALHDPGVARRSPPPATLSGMLSDLHGLDRERYDRVADALALLLAGG